MKEGSGPKDVKEKAIAKFILFGHGGWVEWPYNEIRRLSAKAGSLLIAVCKSKPLRQEARAVSDAAMKWQKHRSVHVGALLIRIGF